MAGLRSLVFLLVAACWFFTLINAAAVHNLVSIYQSMKQLKQLKQLKRTASPLSMKISSPDERGRGGSRSVDSSKNQKSIQFFFVGYKKTNQFGRVSRRRTWTAAYMPTDARKLY